MAAGEDLWEKHGFLVRDMGIKCGLIGPIDGVYDLVAGQRKKHAMIKPDLSFSTVTALLGDSEVLSWSQAFGNCWRGYGLESWSWSRRSICSLGRKAGGGH